MNPIAFIVMAWLTGLFAHLITRQAAVFYLSLMMTIWTVLFVGVETLLKGKP